MIKGLVENLQFNINSTILTADLLNIMPLCVVISLIVFAFLIIFGVFFTIYKFFDTINYYVKRKFDSIDNYINKISLHDSDCKDNDKPKATYKEIKKKYKKTVSELGINTMPKIQTASNVVDKIIEFKKNK